MRRQWFAAILTAFLLLVPGLAIAAPSVSRGEQKFNFLYQECMDRAVRAFQTLGWSNIGQGGAFVQAYRGSEAAYITCNEVAGITVVNVFVASDSQDSGVPGLARQQLQAGMEGSFDGTTVPTGNATSWTLRCCSGRWEGEISITFFQPQGNITGFVGSFSPGLNGGAIRDGAWNTATGEVTFVRDMGGGTAQQYFGTAYDGGNSVSGTWSGAYSDLATSDWSMSRRN